MALSVRVGAPKAPSSSGETADVTADHVVLNSVRRNGSENHVSSGSVPTPGGTTANYSTADPSGGQILNSSLTSDTTPGGQSENYYTTADHSGGSAASDATPEPPGGGIQHYLLRTDALGLRLEGSPLAFSALPLLVHHYAHDT